MTSTLFVTVILTKMTNLAESEYKQLDLPNYQSVFLSAPSEIAASAAVVSLN